MMSARGDLDLGHILNAADLAEWDAANHHRPGRGSGR